MVMSVAALATLVGFVLPWFLSFWDPSLALDLEPEARIAFDRNFASAGPLIVFTCLPLSIDGIVARGVLLVFLASLVLIVVAALISWRRRWP